MNTKNHAQLNQTMSLIVRLTCRNESLSYIDCFSFIAIPSTDEQLAMIKSDSSVLPVIRPANEKCIFLRMKFSECDD